MRTEKTTTTAAGPQISNTAVASDSPTFQLSAFAATFPGDRFSDTLKAAAKKYLLDTIGCGIFGSRTSWSEIINAYVRKLGGPFEATLWVHDFQAAASSVALATGVMAHSFELDDYHPAGKLHPGAVVIPAALAVAEREKAGGAALIQALIVGYETMIRVALAAGALSMRRRGWHITGLCGPFGAAAAAGRLLGLDALQMANALGLAGTQASGLMAFTCDGSNSKRLHPGRSAQSGILAAELARQGFTGPTRVLEYEDGGFLKAVSDTPDPSRLTAGLGEDFLSAGVGIKPYPCCASTHSSIDAVLYLKQKHRFSPEAVQEVVVFNHSVVLKQTCWRYEPISPMQAQMNMGYCIALAISEGRITPELFSVSKIASPDLVALARKVRFEVDPQIEKKYPQTFPGKVLVRLTDGRQFWHEVPGPKGSPENSMSMDEVKQKYHSLADGIIGPDRADRIALCVERIESLDDINTLSALLA